MDLATVLIICVMLLFNSIFAAYELALASISMARLQNLVKENRSGAAAAASMKHRMEASLAVVQIGITLVGAIAAAAGGAGAEESISPWITQAFGIQGKLADLLAIALVVLPLSALTIVVGELVPKTFALRNAELVCLRLSGPMKLFAYIVYPAVLVFEWVTKLVTGLLMRNMDTQGNDAETGLNELRAQAQILRTERVLGAHEEKIILGASRIAAIKVKEIMVPADDIIMLHVNAPLTEVIVQIHLDLHTRFPVTEKPNDPQGIIGYVNFKEIVLLAKTHPHNPRLSEITRPLFDLSENISVSEALKTMVVNNLHLALVRDKEGKVAGILTQEDIFEELVGDIDDEFDRLPRHVIASGKQWVVGGGATIDRARKLMNRPDFAPGTVGEMTISQWITDKLNDHPKGGDAVVIQAANVLVRKVRRHKVTEALIDFEARP